MDIINTSENADLSGERKGLLKQHVLDLMEVLGEMDPDLKNELLEKLEVLARDKTQSPS